jgi:membrane protein
MLTRAAALAYSTVLGIVPILGLVFWYLSHIRVTERWLNLTRTFILKQLNFASSGTFLEVFDKLTSGVQSQSWGWIGLLLFCYTAWSLVTQFGSAVDILLDTAPHAPPGALKQWELVLRRFLIMLWLPLSITLSLVGTEWIQKDSVIRYLLDVRYVGAYLAILITWSVSVATYFFVYKYIPSRSVPWKQALKVAAIVGPASDFIRFFFAWYAKHAVATQKIYGVFAVVPLFILWVQVGWLVLLGGALLIRFPERDVAL